MNDSAQSTTEKAAAAEAAALQLANLSDTTRTNAVMQIADELEAQKDRILDANAVDVERATEKLEAGEYSKAFVDRLTLSSSKISDIAEMVRSVAQQEDPLGKTLEARELDTDLTLFKLSVPIGVIGTVFESRPDALVQIAALSLKSGNAVILKGGSEAAHSNRVLYEIIEEATADIPSGWAQLIEARADVATLLELDESVDLIMPRGSSAFVEYVEQHTSIPVLGHTEGVCHIFIDNQADLQMAKEVIIDAKVQYPAVCNAVETVLIHQDITEQLLPELAAELKDEGVTICGDEAVRRLITATEATTDDWTSEYGDLILAIKTVDSVDAAINHINSYGSKHTESIITDDASTAHEFMRRVDAASVFHNASTRFADGFRFGLGAEVGISTGKTHARGPVGLDGLTTYKYYLKGDGHRVGTYAGESAEPFTHRDTDSSWP
jgi:glutamate-5-semialdehyde dehydrogenase